jgi:hypothetical protein
MEVVSLLQVFVSLFYVLLEHFIATSAVTQVAIHRQLLVPQKVLSFVPMEPVLQVLLFVVLLQLVEVQIRTVMVPSPLLVVPLASVWQTKTNASPQLVEPMGWILKLQLKVLTRTLDVSLGK